MSTSTQEVPFMSVAVEEDRRLRWELTREVGVRVDIPLHKQVQEVGFYDVTDYDQGLIYREPKHLSQVPRKAACKKFCFLPHLVGNPSLPGRELVKKMRDVGLKPPTSVEALAFVEDCKHEWWEGGIIVLGSVFYDSHGRCQVICLKKNKGRFSLDFYCFDQPLEEDHHLLAINLRY